MPRDDKARDDKARDDKDQSDKKAAVVTGTLAAGALAVAAAKQHKDSEDDRQKRLSDDRQKRQERLDSNTKDLYHATSKTAWQQIQRDSKRLKRGKTGICGGGIYFATSEADARRKATQKGVVLKCRVKLGNVLTVDKAGENWSFRILQQRGYDSVCCPRDAGPEYVVYNHDQVVVLDAWETGDREECSVM